MLAGSRGAEPVVVADETWPAAARARADAAVAATRSQGRIGGGDLVVFSSGSTDRPRGIVRTWASWQASVDPLSALIATPAGAVGVPGRLASSLSLHAAWHARVSGRDVVLADEWTPDRLQEVSVIHTLPDRPLRWSTWPPGLRTMVVAGDRATDALRRRCTAQAVRLIEYYGSVEASFVLAGAAPGPLTTFAGVEARLGEDGRLWSRSAYEFREYLTGAGSPGGGGPAVRDERGWLTVGDLAEPAGAGFRLLGRAGTVTTGGHSVQIAEVEAALAVLPGVRGVVVCGLPHGVLGEVLAAVLELDPAAADCRSDVRTEAARRLPAASLPRRWRFVTALPRTVAGKPDRSAACGLFS